MKYVIMLSIFLSLPLHATDSDREQRWIDQTIDFIFEGDPLFLEAEAHRFLAIYTKSQTSSSKAMIVLHGTGFHPDWEQVVRPVRVKMTEHGWNTLSIQLPLLEKSAAYEDYIALYPQVPARMQSATDYLHEQGMKTIVVVAHSQGATMASYYLARTQHDIQALVAIGMSAQHSQQEVNSARSLKSIKIPVLDIYGSRDFPTVLETAQKRLNAAAHNEKYRQVVIPDAYHFFDDTEHEKELLRTVALWLDERL